MTWRPIFPCLLVIVVACGPVATDPTASPVGTSTSTTAVQGTTTTNPPQTTTTTRAPFDWPEATGPPNWVSISMGLPGTTHINVAHGPLGFFSVNNVARGAVVRISSDGVTWTETAILTGPNGEEQVSPRDMIVTEDEYIVAGETWTNTTEGSEQFRDGLWRSSDGRTWVFDDLSELGSDAAVTSLALSDWGLLMVGANRGEDGEGPRPRIWLQRDDGVVEDISKAVAQFDVREWADWAYAEGSRVAVWGESSIWTSSDLLSWTRTEIGPDGPAGVTAVAWFRDSWVVGAREGVWVSRDGSDWLLAAGPEVFATDLVSEGGASFRTLYVQDGYLVALAGVPIRGHPAWCYVDRSTCRQGRYTVLVSPNGYDWRQLPIPGQDELPYHPVETHSMIVDGKLTVAHTMGPNATLSVLEDVGNASPINSGERPNLDFEVVGSGDTIEIGVEYGYWLFTHCPFSPIGPLNGVVWVVDPDSLVESSILALGSVGGYGFILLTAEDEIEYRVGGVTIAVYHPDPDKEGPGFCY